VTAAVNREMQQGSQMERNLTALLNVIHTDTVAQVGASEKSLAQELTQQEASQTTTNTTVQKIDGQIAALQTDHQALQALMQKLNNINDAALTLVRCPAAPTQVTAQGQPSQSPVTQQAGSTPGPATTAVTSQVPGTAQ
jgi:hypothetical protein